MSGSKAVVDTCTSQSDSAKQFKRLIKSNNLGRRVIYVVKHRTLRPLKKAAMLGLAQIEELLGICNKDLLRYKDTHRNQTCIIVGNGPSLRIQDLDAMHRAGIVCFGSNRICDLFNQTQWRPKYMCVMDTGFLTSLDSIVDPIEYVADVLRAGVDHMFVIRTLKKQLDGAAGSNSISYVTVPLSAMYTTHIGPFSTNPAVFINDLGSVTHFSIQLACYMGFKKIYLYGVDNSYKKYLGIDGSFHVENGVMSHPAGMRKVLDDIDCSLIPKSKYQAYEIGGFADMRKASKGFEVCKKYASEHGVCILNVTRGGELEVFERLDFEEMIKMEASVHGC